MEPLPEVLKIGHIDYLVREEDRSWMRETDRYGHCDRDQENIVVVSEDVSVSCRFNTFIHEILHALYAEYNIHGCNDEEHVVTCLGNGITQVLKDNPEMLPVIRELGDETHYEYTGVGEETVIDIDSPFRGPKVFHRVPVDPDDYLPQTPPT